MERTRAADFEEHFGAHCGSLWAVEEQPRIAEGLDAGRAQVADDGHSARPSATCQSFGRGAGGGYRWISAMVWQRFEPMVGGGIGERTRSTAGRGGNACAVEQRLWGEQF